MNAFRVLLSTAALAATVARLPAYERMTGPSGVLSRPAGASFLVDPSVAPGLRNAEGKVLITAESNPVGALSAATAAWSTIPGSRARLSFAVASGSLRVQSLDGVNVFSFADDPGTRSVVGSAIAVTLVVSAGDATIFDSDILFNPKLQFSTIPTEGCFDIQNIATHELGHALGAGHSYMSSATMFAFSDTEETWARYLTSDDIAFATSTYPANRTRIGGVGGKITYGSGKAVAGALVLVFSTSGDFVVGVTTNLLGTYSAQGLPPGDYMVAAQPVAPYFGGSVSGSDPFDVPDWQAVFHGNSGDPRALPVTGGQTAQANLTVPDGSAKLRVDFAYASNSASFMGMLVPSGASVGLYLYGKGFDNKIRPEDITLYGPGLRFQPDSLYVSSSSDPAQSSILGFLVDIEAHAGWSEAVVAVKNGESTVVQGGIRILPSGPHLRTGNILSSASLFSGGVAPGEIVMLAGSGMGPRDIVLGEFDASNKLETSVGGTRVEFDGSAAPLFYSSAGQVQAQVPFEVSGRTSTHVQLRYQDGSADVILGVVRSRPEVFNTCDARPCIYNLDGTLNDDQHPAPRGSYLIVYGTGQGLVQPGIATGAAAPLNPLRRASFSAKIGGIPATVDFAGLTPGYVGLMQLDIKVPDKAPVGSTELVISANGISNRMLIPVAVK